jgi:hypothetical protein
MTLGGTTRTPRGVPGILLSSWAVGGVRLADFNEILAHCAAAGHRPASHLLLHESSVLDSHDAAGPAAKRDSMREEIQGLESRWASASPLSCFVRVRASVAETSTRMLAAPPAMRPTEASSFRRWSQALTTARSRYSAQCEPEAFAPARRLEPRWRCPARCC